MKLRNVTDEDYTEIGLRPYRVIEVDVKMGKEILKNYEGNVVEEKDVPVKKGKK
jgi:hypothetical protein